jgi:uncharacterized membrane protein
MDILTIIIIAVVIYVVVGLWCMCRVAANADKKMREHFNKKQ